jgi:hypothetical protein
MDCFWSSPNNQKFKDTFYLTGQSSQAEAGNAAGAHSVPAGLLNGDAHDT